MRHHICKNCGKDYEYIGSSNFINFCPHCHHMDWLECEYGFGPVTPCEITLGNELIGMVNKEEDFTYRLTSQKYGLNIRLTKQYLEALEEAGDIIAKCL